MYLVVRRSYATVAISEKQNRGLLGQYETEQDEAHLGAAFAKLGNCADRLSVLLTHQVDGDIPRHVEDLFLALVEAIDTQTRHDGRAAPGPGPATTLTHISPTPSERATLAAMARAARDVVAAASKASESSNWVMGATIVRDRRKGKVCSLIVPSRVARLSDWGAAPDPGIFMAKR